MKRSDFDYFVEKIMIKFFEELKQIDSQKTNNKSISVSPAYTFILPSSHASPADSYHEIQSCTRHMTLLTAVLR